MRLNLLLPGGRVHTFDLAERPANWTESLTEAMRNGTGLAVRQHGGRTVTVNAQQVSALWLS